MLHLLFVWRCSCLPSTDPAVYTFFDLYPTIDIALNYDHAEATHTTLSWATSQSGYPAFNLCTSCEN